MAGYVGNVPVPEATQTRSRFVATEGQTSFPTAGYSPGYVDVYLNGVHLVDILDYSAVNGTDLVLVLPATAGDNVELTSFSTFNIGAGGGGGATGGVTDQVFYENDATISYDYTITAGKNAGTFGPITVADGVTVTIPDGSVWTIV